MGLDRLVSVPLPKEAGTCSGNLAICGGGRTVFEDLYRWDGYQEPYDTMAVNDVGEFLPDPLHHWYSNHYEKLSRWRDNREWRGRLPPSMMHTNRDGISNAWVVNWPLPSMGTSGLIACFVGLCLGYGKIVLCGVPLTNDGHFYDTFHTKTNFVNEAPDDIWCEARDKVFDGRVFSMSGRSREMLGEP